MGLLCRSRALAQPAFAIGLNSHFYIGINTGVAAPGGADARSVSPTKRRGTRLQPRPSRAIPWQDSRVTV